MTKPDTTAQTYGLTECLRVPIGAVNPEALRDHVGVISKRIHEDGRIVALCVEPLSRPRKHPKVQLWKEPDAAFYESQLHPAKQIWVHFAYARYRKAFGKQFGVEIPATYVLDHVQNRKAVDEAIRSGQWSFPYLRLCPVSRGVNSSGGKGGEAMQRNLLADPNQRIPTDLRLQSRILYADPFDLTKMINVKPGSAKTGFLEVALKHRLFYP